MKNNPTIALLTFIAFFSCTTKTSDLDRNIAELKKQVSRLDNKNKNGTAQIARKRKKNNQIVSLQAQQRRQGVVDQEKAVIAAAQRTGKAKHLSDSALEKLLLKCKSNKGVKGARQSTTKRKRKNKKPR